jgi:hypothetical protein
MYIVHCTGTVGACKACKGPLVGDNKRHMPRDRRPRTTDCPAYWVMGTKELEKCTVRKEYFLLGRKVVVYTTAERADTLPLFLLYPNIYSMAMDDTL